MNTMEIITVLAIVLVSSYFGKLQYERGNKLNNTLQWTPVELDHQGGISDYVGTQVNFIGEYTVTMANCGIKFGYEHPEADYEKMSTGFTWLLKAYVAYLILPFAFPALAIGIILLDKARRLFR